MERTEVESSNIKSMGYAEFEQILELEFNNEAVYQYSGVPKEVYENLVSSESKGRFFAKEIKGKFDYKLVE